MKKTRIFGLSVLAASMGLVLAVPVSAGTSVSLSAVFDAGDKTTAGVTGDSSTGAISTDYSDITSLSMSAADGNQSVSSGAVDASTAFSTGMASDEVDNFEASYAAGAYAASADLAGADVDPAGATAVSLAAGFDAEAAGSATGDPAAAADPNVATTYTNITNLSLSAASGSSAVAGGASDADTAVTGALAAKSFATETDDPGVELAYSADDVFSSKVGTIADDTEATAVSMAALFDATTATGDADGSGSAIAATYSDITGLSISSATGGSASAMGAADDTDTKENAQTIAADGQSETTYTKSTGTFNNIWLD